jgi:DNA-binding NtrC family response regulator
MPTLWIVHRDAVRRAVLARLAGAGEDTILGDPSDRLFEGSPPADVVVLGLSGDFEEELEFAHRHAPRLANARWLLVTDGPGQGDAKRLFDTLDTEVVPFPPSAESLRRRVREAMTRRVVEPLSERRARDAIAVRFTRWFAGLDLPELLRALDPRLARTPVLIRGEHGTGRTILAHYLHAFGGSTGGALVVVPCAPESRAEDLIAAIEPTARSERARRSLTIVLEDVERLPLAVQKEVRGWLDVAAPRVVAHSAWVRWLGTVTEQPGDPTLPLDPGLREALAAIPIHLPPLRESPDRVEALAEDVTAAFLESTGGRPRRLAPDALEALRRYPWPGNLRELEAVVTRTLAATSSEWVVASDLRFESDPLLRPRSATPESSEETPEPFETPSFDAVPPRPIEVQSDQGESSPEFETWALMEEPESEPEPAPEPLPPVAGPAALAPSAPRAAPAELVGDQELRRFLAAISHELGNSVVPLRTAAELLPERFADPEFRDRFSALVETDARRMQDVLARLSRFASFAAPAAQHVDLSGLFDSLVEEQRADLESRQILLLRELERTQPYVVGDEAQLHFALDALLRKALQLVKPRGDLYLASRFHPHSLRGVPSIRTLLRFESTARIAPTAAAVGVSLSETALDLLLTEAVVRAHGGRFTLDAGEGAETVILIDLPAPGDLQR